MMSRLFRSAASGLCALVAVTALESLAEDAYLESDGTQSVNTGYFVNPRTRIEVDFQMTEIANQVRIFGADIAPTEFSALYIGNDGTKFNYGFGDTFGGWTAADVDLNRHTFVLDSPNGVAHFVTAGVTNTLTHLADHARTKTATDPLAIFADCRNPAGNDMSGCAKMRLYSFRIFEDGVLLHDYEPAILRELAGLYDRVTGEFLLCDRLTNSPARPETTFASGGDIRTLSEDEDAGYLLSDGTQFLNSRHFISPKSTLEFDFAFVGTPVAQTRLFGVTSGSGVEVGMYADSSSWLQFFCGDTWSGKYVSVVPLSRRFRGKIDIPADKCSLALGHTLDVATARINGTLTKTATFPAAICGYTSQDASGTHVMANTGVMRIYGFKVWEDGQLVHDYVPCLSGGVPGMKDRVDGAFITSETIHRFAYGGRILREEGDGYIENDSTNQQYVDTGLILDGRSRIEFDYAQTTDLQTYLFGAGGSGQADTLVFGGFVSPGIGFNCQDVDANTKFVGIDMSYARRTLTIDAKNGRTIVATAGYTNTVCTFDTARTFTTKYSLLLMGGRWKASFNAVTPMRLYGCRIYRDDVLVRDYVPCVSGGIAGLKDQVGGSFVSAGTYTRFACGGDILREAGDGYIENTALDRQYIDTGLKLDGQSCVEYDFALTTTSQSYLFGIGGEASGYLSLGAYATSVIGVNCKDGGSDNLSTGVTPSYTRRTLILDAKNSKAIVLTAEDATNAVVNLTNTHVCDMKETFLLMGCRWGGGNTLHDMAPHRLYGCRIRKNGELVRNYVPFVKNGVPGLRDTLNGGFVTYAGKNAMLKCGGLIETDGSDSAYLESSGFQAIETGYVPNKNTKLVCDYQLVCASSEQDRVYGSMSDKMCAELYIQGGCNTLALGYNSYYAGGGWKCVNQACVADLARHQVTLDLARGVWSVDGGAERALDAIEEGTDAAKVATLWLFAKHSWYNYGNFSRARIYSFEIYEAGVLKHRYLPYSFNGTVGLKDTMTGDTFTDEMKSTTPFRIAGCGCGADNAAFAVSPSDAEAPYGGTTTLSAFAPGALSYQWYCDGEALDGETNMTCVVPWKRLGPDRSYVVKAAFDVYGVVTEVSSAAATVVNERHGALLIVR